jgi:hypothetical protein
MQSQTLSKEQIGRLSKYILYFDSGRKVTRLRKKSNEDIVWLCQHILQEGFYYPVQVIKCFSLEPYFKYHHWHKDSYYSIRELLNKIELIYTKRPTRFWD